jgi:transposase
VLDEATALPDDPDDLRSLAERLIAEAKAQAVLIEKLRHQLAGHRAHRFGASAETAEQLQLALETSELAAAAMTAKLRLPEPPEEKGKPKRRPIPDHVPRTEIELLPAQDDCAACGSRLRQVGEDVTEELEYVPGRFVVNRITRPRFACSVCDGFTQAPLPSRPIERGRPGPGLLAHALVGKYADHLPLYRQSQVYAHEGIDLDRSTLADWTGQVDGASGAAGRSDRSPRAGGPCHPRPRHARADARARHRQDADGAALDLCARRAAMGRTGTAGRALSLLGGPEGQSTGKAPRGLQGLDAR